MSDQVQYRRGSTAAHASFIGKLGEMTVDTDKSVVVVHDGARPGGYPLARSDQVVAPAAGTAALGDLFYATGGSASARLADVAAGSVLVSGGVGAPPAWSTALPAGMTIATPAAGDTSTKIANMAAVAAAITALVNSSPATLDTLKELADAIGDDPNFATTVANQIAGRAAKGANSDITQLLGLTTALSIGQGGTGATSASAALNALGGLAAVLLGAANGVASLDGGSKVPVGQLPVVPLANGGTGATSAAAALTSLGALASVLLGVANGVASLDGNGKLPAAQIPVVPVASGGTGATSASAALSSLGALAAALLGAANGAASLDGSSKLPVAQLPTVPVALGGTGSTTGSAALVALGAAARGANADITALTALTAPASWTPAIGAAAAGDLAVSYTRQVGIVWRIGPLVFVFADVAFTPTYSSQTGVIRLTGLPIVAHGTIPGFLLPLAYYPQAWPGSTGTVVWGQIPASAAYVNFMGAKSGAAPVAATVPQFVSGTAATVTMVGIYLAGAAS